MMKYDCCDGSININEPYIYLDGYEKIFCSDHCLLTWLDHSHVIIYDIATEENINGKC